MTSRERRVHQAMTNTVGKAPTFSVFGEPWHIDRRVGPAERRVASYRPLMDWFCRNVIEAQDRQDIKQMHDLLAALRRPKVTEEELAEAIRPCLDDLDDGQTKEDFLMAVAEDCARTAVERLK